MKGFLPALALVCALTAGCADSDRSANRSSAASVAVASSCAEDDYRGPWAECWEADWVRTITRVAGYEIAGDTGSALIAQGQGHSFYIWATKGLGSLAGASRLGCRIGDAKVWAGRGGMDDWRYWQAQGYTFWLSAGPLMTSRSPDPCELAALVQESRLLPPPSVGP